MQLEYIYIKTIIQYTVVLHSPAVDIRVRARGGNCVAHFPTLARRRISSQYCKPVGNRFSFLAILSYTIGCLYEP